MTSRLSRWAMVAAAALVVTAIPVALPAAEPAQAAPVPLRITPNPAYQGDEFEGWGTSLVWFANATGGYPEAVRQDLFDKVFGEDGLNLNIARYNVGGGNATNVPGYLRPGGAVEGWWNPDLGLSDASGPITSSYADRTRYAEAWDAENPDHYNFDADETQLWWVNALKEKITKWEAFSNSPPYFLTQSGYVSGGINNATSEQLPAANTDEFASYLVNVVEHVEETYGIDFETLDPFNEPNTNYWSTQIGANGWPTSASRQEGAHIGPAVQDTMIKALDAKLNDTSTTTDVAISAMDETNPSIFATNWNAWSQSAKDKVEQLNVHTYGTSDRLRVRDIAKSSDKPLWMSEVEGDWDGTGFNQTNIENGLGMAGRIIDDMRELEPEAWVFWQPVEDLYNMQNVENKNWGSVFIDFDCNAEGKSLRRIAAGEADPTCKVLTNAKFNTVRNFTHYIHPGDHFIPVDNTQTAAALSGEGDGVTLVHTNTDANERQITLDLSQFATIAEGATVTPVVTSQSPSSDVTAKALVEGAPIVIDRAAKTAVITVPAKSVTTLVVNGVSGVGEKAVTVQDDHSYQLVGVQSGKALTAPSSSTASATITTSGVTAEAAARQAWKVDVLSGEGTARQRVTLTNGDGKLLSGSSAGTRLVSASAEHAASDPSLQWIPSTTNGVTFGFVNAGTEQALDVNGQGTADGTSVGLWPSNNGGNQLWSVRDTAIESVAPIVVSTVAGTPPQLPATVNILYRGGAQRSAAVTWDLEGLDWSTPGTTVVDGSGVDVFGAPFTGAKATVEIGGFAGTDPVSLTTYAGANLAAVKASAPTSVPAQIGTSDNRFSADVIWNWDAVTADDLASPGVIVVPGSAASNSAGEAALEATLSVIVTAAVQRNVAPASTATATFTESSSYSVDRTKNGVLDDKGWSNWRSANKNAQDTLTYALAGTNSLDHATIRFYKDGSTNSWARSLRVDTQNAAGNWVTGTSTDVPVPTNGSAPMVNVPLNGVAGKAVRVVLDAYANTHMVVSEVEVYANSAAPSSIADLVRLTADGRPIDGFTPSQTGYELAVTGAAWPSLRGVALDSDATVKVTQPATSNGAGAITVSAPDGTRQVYTVDVTRTVGVTSPSIGGTALLGEALTAQVDATDPADAAVAYRWYRGETAIPGATGATYVISEADLGHPISVRATASAPGLSSGVAQSQPVVPQEVPIDTSTQKPGVGVLTSDNGWDTGLHDGDYRITMNLWWGTNGSLFKLYENGDLIKTVRLTAASPAAQTAVVPIAGRGNGTYVYTGELVNASGKSVTQAVAVTVKDANPATPVLSHDNWDGDGGYIVTANMWWGTNATSYTLLQDGAPIASGTLTAKTPTAQKVAVPVSGATKGTHVYTVRFTNDAGATTSAPLSVKVTK